MDVRLLLIANAGFKKIELTCIGISFSASASEVICIESDVAFEEDLFASVL